MSVVNIDIPLAPHQKEFVLRRSGERRLAMLTGVSCGKTTAAGVLLTKEALAGHNWIAASQSDTSWKLIMKPAIDKVLHKLGMSPSEMFNGQLLRYTFPNGAFIQGASSHAQDRLTGLTDCSGLLTDESAIMSRATRNFLEDRCRGYDCNHQPIVPRYRYIGTPPIVGNTEWFREFIKKNPNNVIHCSLLDMEGKGGITKEFIDAQIEKYGGMESALCRSQVLGEFLDDGAMCKVFTDKCFEKKYLVDAGFVSMGIDCAGQGRDYNVFFVCNSTRVLEIKKVKNADLYEMGSIARSLIEKYGVRQVCIDTTGGFGNGIYDLLKVDPRLQVFGINFGQSADDSENYLNARCEMYTIARDYLLQQFTLEDEECIRQLDVMTYEISNTGKMKLVPKDVLKDLLGCSPDVADAFVLALYKRKALRTLAVRKNENYNTSLRTFGR